MVQSVRVLGFLPSINSLHFLNAWPMGIPDYTFNVLGQALTLGDAGNGLCGGMAFTVKDLFEAGLLPPADTTDPAGGTPLFNYIVARLTNSFNEDNVNQYLSWIQMSDHDTGLAHGLAWHEITEEWPKIKADLDSNHVSPLGLVHGQEPPTVGLFTGIQDLGHCHQVLAWGYDLDGSGLTIYIYDPDNPGDGNTITLDIANPGNSTPITISNWDGFYRGFFQCHYTYHDPRTPVSAAFIETVVSSPGITPAGEIIPTWVDQIILEQSGNPLVRFTGQVHDWSSPVSSAWASETILQARVIITTGSDDLRGGNGPDDNCDAMLTLASGESVPVQNINDSLHWQEGETHTAVLPLPAGTKVMDITAINLRTQFSGGISGDNWNVNQLSLVASYVPTPRFQLPVQVRAQVPALAYQENIDRIVAFVAGSDGHLYDKFWNGTQWVWEDQGTPPSGAIVGYLSAVYQTSIDRLVVFVVGSDGHLYDKFWNGTQWVWEDQGMPPNSTVNYVPGDAYQMSSAVYQASIDRLVVFVAGGDGHLYDKFWNGTQWVWEDQGTPPNVGFVGWPSAVHQTSIDRLVVFVIGNDGHLYDKFWNGTQWVWEDQGTPPDAAGGLGSNTAPSAVYQASIDRLVVFAIGVNGHLYDKFWSGTQWVWEDQGTPPNVGPAWYAPGAVDQASIDRLVVFVAGSDGHLYDKFWNGTQWVWEDQGTPPPDAVFQIAAPPSSVYQSSIDRLVVFVVGNDGHLYDKFWNGTQWVWEDQGSPPLMAAVTLPSAVCQTSVDRLHVFVGGSDGHLYDRFWNGAEWVWEDQGTPPSFSWITSPSAVYQASVDRLVVFVVGENSSLCDKFWGGAQWVWEDQGVLPQPYQTAITSPSAAYQASIDRLVVFVAGGDGHLYDKFWSGTQWVWEDQGTPPNVGQVSSPSAAYQASIDRLVVFVVGNDGHLYDKFWNGTQWVWEDQGTPPNVTAVASPSAVYQAPINRVTVFVVGNDGHLYGKVWNGTEPVWVDQGVQPVPLGGAPLVTLNRASINFGSLSLGDTSPTEAITVTNTGSGPLSISGISPTGANASDFDITTDSCTGAVLSPGRSCTVGVSFSPGAPGACQAALTFADTASDSPQHVGLTGQGIKLPIGH